MNLKRLILYRSACKIDVTGFKKQVYFNRENSKFTCIFSFNADLETDLEGSGLLLFDTRIPIFVGHKSLVYVYCSLVRHSVLMKLTRHTLLFTRYILEIFFFLGRCYVYGSASYDV